MVTFEQILQYIMTVTSYGDSKTSQGKDCQILKDYLDIFAQLEQCVFHLSVLHTAEKTDSTLFDLGNSLGGIF